MKIAEQIVTFPNETLTKKAAVITKNELKGTLNTILTQVKKYVEEDNGTAGLALPQVGISKRAFIAKLIIDEKELTEIFINPRIIPIDRKKIMRNEGCLSIPNEEFTVERFSGVEVFYQGLNGKAKSIKLKNWNARVVQHELDHLNGVLISQIGERVITEIAQ